MIIFFLKQIKHNYVYLRSETQTHAHGMSGRDFHNINKKKQIHTEHLLRKPKKTDKNDGNKKQLKKKHRHIKQKNKQTNWF